MGERSEESEIAAQYVHELASTRGLLSDEHKNLAEIGLKVAYFIETDPRDEDFGRIKDIDNAEEYAYFNDKVRRSLLNAAGLRVRFMEKGGGYKDPNVTPESLRGEANEKANEETSKQMAHELYEDMKERGFSEEEAQKIANDLLITQGDVDSMNARTMLLRKDVESTMRGPFVALRAAVVLQKAILFTRKSRGETTIN